MFVTFFSLQYKLIPCELTDVKLSKSFCNLCKFRSVFVNDKLVKISSSFRVFLLLEAIRVDYICSGDFDTILTLQKSP